MTQFTEDELFTLKLLVLTRWCSQESYNNRSKQLKTLTDEDIDVEYHLQELYKKIDKETK